MNFLFLYMTGGSFGGKPSWVNSPQVAVPSVEDIMKQTVHSEHGPNNPVSPITLAAQKGVCYVGCKRVISLFSSSFFFIDCLKRGTSVFFSKAALSHAELVHRFQYNNSSTFPRL